MSEVMPKDSPTAFAVRVLGLTPHLTQAQFLESRAPVKVACAGRRWGKSTACAIDVLWWAITRLGTTQFVIAPTADQARIIWQQARELAEGSLLTALITRAVESPFPELRLATRDASGNEVESTIMARSSSHDAKYLRGHGADRIIVDEAAFVPEAVLSQTVPPMLSASAFRELVLISTPFGVGTYFHNRFIDGQNGVAGVASFHFPSRSNPRLPADYLEEQRRQMTDLAFRTEYEALFLEAQASVFRYDTIQAAIDADIEPGPLTGHQYVIGYDPAKYSDRAGLVVLDTTRAPYRAVEALDIGGRSYLTQAAQVQELAARYHNAGVLLDATAHDQMLEQLVHSRVNAEGYRFTSESKRNLIDGVVLALERGGLRIPNHPDLIRELTYYRYETTAAGNVKLGAPTGPGHFDDLVTALALAVWHADKAPALPYSWLRTDPAFRRQVLGEPEDGDREQRDETRTAARVSAYYAALGYDAGRSDGR